MQTRYASRGSVAYDLDKFQSRRRVRTRKPTLVVARPSQKAKARVCVLSVVKMLAVVALLLSIVVTMLYSRAVLTELNQQISAAAIALNAVKSDNTRLTAELESKISLRNIEEYATQTLGMSTLDKQQITYVDLSVGDKIELTKESPKQNLVDRIQLAISNVQEYIPSN